MKLSDMINSLSNQHNEIKVMQNTLDAKYEEIKQNLINMENLVNGKIDENLSTLSSEVETYLSKTQKEKEDFKAEIENKIIESINNNLIEYVNIKFQNDNFLNAIVIKLIEQDGKNIVESKEELIRDRINLEIQNYILENFHTDILENKLFEYYKRDINDAMKRRIRIETKSILNNWNFDSAIINRFEELVLKYLNITSLTKHAINSNIILLNSQSANLNALLEYLGGNSVS